MKSGSWFWLSEFLRLYCTAEKLVPSKGKWLLTKITSALHTCEAFLLLGKQNHQIHILIQKQYWYNSKNKSKMEPFLFFLSFNFFYNKFVIRWINHCDEKYMQKHLYLYIRYRSFQIKHKKTEVMLCGNLFTAYVGTPLTLIGFSLEFGLKTLFIAENQLPFFPIFLAYYFSPCKRKQLKFLGRNSQKQRNKNINSWST